MLLVFSLVGFIVLMHAAGSQIRVDFVLASIGRHSRAQLARRLPRQDPTDVVAQDPAGTPDARLAPVAYRGENGQIVAIDTRRLARIAQRQAITLVLDLRVGDAITRGTPIARTDAADAPGLARAISRCLVVDDERSLVHDPLYALRLLVDIAIRALSPAVNDPTTAVRALDEIEGVLRSAADRRLGTVRLDLTPGLLAMSTATWDEVVDLALLEIAECGGGQVQITRTARGPPRRPDPRRAAGPPRRAAAPSGEPGDRGRATGSVRAGGRRGPARRQAGPGRIRVSGALLGSAVSRGPSSWRAPMSKVIGDPSWTVLTWHFAPLAAGVVYRPSPQRNRYTCGCGGLRVASSPRIEELS